MQQLTTKIQYKNCETGEYVDERKRTLDEILALVKGFPWALQRQKIEITPTNPSITIENGNNEFLKVAPYFHDKYVLYYFTNESKLYRKAFVRIEDTYSHIKAFFELPYLSIEGFRLENTWLQNPAKHFYSQNFTFTVTTGSACKYLLSTSWMQFAFSLFIIGMVAFYHPNLPPWFYAIILIMCFLVGGGLNLILFFNYYHYSTGKVLKMSRGNDIFYFGPAEEIMQYNKNDIESVTQYNDPHYRSPINDFVLFKLVFKDGRVIYLPNILLEEYALLRKLPQPIQHKKRFPFIKL